MPNSLTPPISATPRHEWLLRLLCALLFVGRAQACWNGDMPLRALLWDETLLGEFLPKLTGIDWNTWVSSPSIDAVIDRVVQGQGWVFLLLAVAVLVPVRRPAFGLIYLFGALNLLLLTGLGYLDSNGAIGGLLEHASQYCLPLVLYLVIFTKRWNTSAMRVASVAVALTFAVHGVLAIGFHASTPWLDHPRPGKFTEMLMLSLPIGSERVAVGILIAAGILDLLAAALIFTRGRLAITALAYMVVWGALTALARPWAYFEPTAAAESLGRWIPEALFRSPHWGLPLWLLLLRWRDRAKKVSPSEGASRQEAR